MTILDRYLAGAVLGGTLVTLGALVPLIGLVLLADEAESLTADGYGLAHAFAFMLLSLPRYLYQLFPIATLIGALLGLGVLASRSELVAMRAAGVSVARIVRAGLLGGLLLAVVGVLIGELLAPAGSLRAAELRREALSGGVAQRTPDGFWAVDEGAYVNIRDIGSGHRLQDISIYQVDLETGSLVLTHAATASYVGGRWMLEEIARSRVSAEGVAVERIAQAGWDSMLDPGLLKVVVADPDSLAVWGLYKYVRFMATNGQDAGNYAVAFWGRITHPLLTLSMVLVAIPLLMGSSRSAGLGRRMLAGILVGILYYLLSRGFGYLALLFGLEPFIAALAPPLLFIGAATLLLRRVG